MRLLLSKPTPIETVFARPRPRADIQRTASRLAGTKLLLFAFIDGKTEDLFASEENIRHRPLPKARPGHYVPFTKRDFSRSIYDN